MYEITTRPSDALDDHDPEALINYYVAGWLLGFGRENTVKAYGTDIRQWLAFCANHHLDPLAARRAHIDGWARTMERGKLAPRTVARKLASVASWYSYLVSECALDTSPVAHVKRPPLPKTGSTSALTRSELRALIAAAETRGPTEHTLVLFLSRTGMRIGATLGADVEGLSVDSGHRVLRHVRKRGIESTTLLVPEVADAIDRYLDGRETGPLFLRDGRRMNQLQAWRLTRSLAAQAGIDHPDRVTPHALRATYITLALKAGIFPDVVKTAVGHELVTTTMLYDRREQDLTDHASYRLAAYLRGGE